MNNRNPIPWGWPNVQLYSPSFVFNFTQDGNRTVTDTYVTAFSVGVSVTQTNFGGGPFEGTSFIRDSLRNGDPVQFLVVEGKDSGAPYYILGLPATTQIEAAQLPKPVIPQDEDKAPVNLDGLSETQGAGQQ